MTYSSLHLSLLAFLLALAAASDLPLRKIPNGLSVAVAASGVAAQWAAAGARGVGSGIGAAAIVFVLLWFPWTKRALGGGDLKLGVGAATWVGLGRLPQYLLASALVAGTLAVICYLASARRARAQIRSNLLHAALRRSVEAPLGAVEGRVPVPAGAALGAGALVALSLV